MSRQSRYLNRLERRAAITRGPLNFLLETVRDAYRLEHVVLADQSGVALAHSGDAERAHWLAAYGPALLTNGPSESSGDLVDHVGVNSLDDILWLRFEIQDEDFWIFAVKSKMSSDVEEGVALARQGVIHIFDNSRGSSLAS